MSSMYFCVVRSTTSRPCVFGIMSHQRRSISNVQMRFLSGFVSMKTCSFGSLSAAEHKSSHAWTSPRCMFVLGVFCDGKKNATNFQSKNCAMWRKKNLPENKIVEVFFFVSQISRLRHIPGPHGTNSGLFKCHKRSHMVSSKSRGIVLYFSPGPVEVARGA